MFRKYVIGWYFTVLNSSKITDAGTNSDLIDRAGELSDLEDRVDNSLPGSHRGGDPSERRTRPKVRVTAVEFSPTTAAFAAASTEGLLIFSINQELIFDPFDLMLMSPLKPRWNPLRRKNIWLHWSWHSV